MTQAVIEFDLDGTIITANDCFLKTMGYTLDEIKGQHHSIFVDPVERGSALDKQFWRGINDGKAEVAEFKRIGKGGKEVWIQASYNPIFDDIGKPFKVVTFALDITEAVKQRTANALYLSKSENLPFNILLADRNFKVSPMSPVSARTLKVIQQFRPMPVENSLGQNIDILQ